MKRRNLLKGLGAIGLSTLLPIPNVSSTIKRASKSIRNEALEDAAGCWLTPALTEGPFYLNGNLIRQNITEGRPGIAFHMTINVINFECNPIPNVLVDVWHADKDGNYSAFGAFVGQTFLRGTQLSDNNGVVVFDTIYPGWYPGRATHIHFKVRLTSSTYVTSQYCFLDSVNNAVYATPLYSGRGPNPTTNAEDGIFNNANPEFLVMTAVPNASGGYVGTYTIGINAPTGINEMTEEADGFSLQQNYPNPFNPSTKIIYTIPVNSNVKLNVYDGFGREVAVIIDKKQSAGTYEVKFNGENFSSGFYFYKLDAGGIVKTREMLLLK
ncbi:MAG: T9SS type A sorting domain-containing protein [Bacteroidota bacterium]|nr:T9SS type A sorting domain-containing protein [Bacteroidota bacterium]